MPAGPTPALTLSQRQYRIAMGFLVGATVSQLIALPFLFPPRPGWLAAVWRIISHPAGTVTAWCAAAAVTAIYVIYSATRSSVIRSFAFSPAAWAPLLGLRLVAIPMAFVTGFFEEVFFRKIVMDVAANHACGPILQIGVSAIIFGLAHAIWAVFGGKLRAALAVMIATGALGGLLAAVYLLGARSIGPCIAAHILMNLILEPWLVLSSATGSWGRRPGVSSI